MKIGPIEWNPVGFLHEDVKNTRFLLTLVGIFALLVSFMGIYTLILRNVVIDSNLQTILVMIITAVVTLVGTSYNSYFKDRQTTEADAVLTSKLELEATKTQ